LLGQNELPERLKHIPDPPALLFVRGQAAAMNAPGVAIVGARRCTPLGARTATRLAADIHANGLSIFSGLALGIDAAAHRGGLEGGVAVLGCGVDVSYPRAHRTLAAQLLEAGGALVSEYPPGVQPRRYHFPERNRLISGLSLAVVIVEASERSGSLITARMALEQGRDVLAVPGPIVSAVSRGCHRLIQQGAGLAQDAQDVLDALPEHRVVVRPTQSQVVTEGASAHGQAGGMSALAASAREVLAAIDFVSTSFDEVMARSGLASNEVARAVVELELAGFVKAAGGGYIRSSG
jgi:DNA processing protein